jgi:hypothetical protein
MASWMPMVTDGEPTKLYVTAWMCHEGKNDNGLVFRAEDFPAAAARIGGKNLLPMDWNHSAVLPDWMNWDCDPKAIGVWYAAEAKLDPAAKNGAGAQGIELQGIVWAWAFADKANDMLAMQQARGYVEFSMACIPTTSVFGSDADGPYEVAVQPVFFTLSALDVPPADKDGKGIVEFSGKPQEDPQGTDGDDSYELEPFEVPLEEVPGLGQAIAAAKEMTADNPSVTVSIAVRKATHRRASRPVKTEKTMPNKTNEELQTAALEALTEAHEALKAEMLSAQEKLTAATTAAAEKDAVIATLTARAEQAELERDALKSELQAAAEKMAQASVELEAKTAELTAIAQAKAEEERAARWATRFEALPQAFRDAFAKRSEEEQARFIAKWAMVSDDEYKEYLGDLYVGSEGVRLSYQQLSDRLGPLPTGGAADMSSKIAALKV